MKNAVLEGENKQLRDLLTEKLRIIDELVYKSNHPTQNQIIQISDFRKSCALTEKRSSKQIKLSQTSSKLTKKASLNISHSQKDLSLGRRNELRVVDSFSKTASRSGHNISKISNKEDIKIMLESRANSGTCTWNFIPGERSGISSHQRPKKTWKQLRRSRSRNTSNMSCLSSGLEINK